MMNRPLFSVIIPMYNVEQYIERCLQSVFNQNITSAKYEVILINDGSPDNSETVAEAYCSGRPDVKIIRQNNRGLGGARNTGIINATGKYLIFLDSDDWLLPNALNALSESINNEDVVEFAVLVKNDDKTLHTIDFANTSVKSGIDHYFGNTTINSACNKLYNRVFLLEHNLLFEEHIYGEDIQFNTRVFYLAKRVKSVDQHAIVFYQSQHSITRSKDYSKKLKYLNDLTEVIISINKFKNKYVQDISAANYFYERGASLTINSILFSLKNKISPALTKKFIQTLKDSGSYNLTAPVRHRNTYRLLFKNRLMFEIILFINKLRP